jgi:hypothetical protein
MSMPEPLPDRVTRNRAPSGASAGHDELVDPAGARDDPDDQIWRAARR